MFRKLLILSLSIAILLAGMGGTESQAQKVASVSQKGTLLVFPLVAAFSSIGVDTLITIGNDASSPVTVKCYWMYSNQDVMDFEFLLTANQPVWFSAMTGEGSLAVAPFGDNATGELKCWAIDTSTDPESLRQFNNLYGSVMLLDASGFPNPIAFEYNAWAFKLNSNISSPNPYSGPLILDGASNYDACPGYLSYNFLTARVYNDYIYFPSTLFLSPCQQDLRQDRTPICTKAKYDVWNENETKFTGAYSCIKCYFEGTLADLGYGTWDKCDLPTCKKTGFGGNNFLKEALHTDFGRFRVTPSTFPACQGVFAQYGQDGKTAIDACPPANQYQTPFVGVLMTQLLLGSGQDGGYSLITTTGSSAGVWTAPKPLPQILWDAGSATQSAPNWNAAGITSDRPTEGGWFSGPSPLGAARWW